MRSTNALQMGSGQAKNGPETGTYMTENGFVLPVKPGVHARPAKIQEKAENDFSLTVMASFTRPSAAQKTDGSSRLADLSSVRQRCALISNSVEMQDISLDAMRKRIQERRVQMFPGTALNKATQIATETAKREQAAGFMHKANLTTRVFMSWRALVLARRDNEASLTVPKNWNSFQKIKVRMQYAFATFMCAHRTVCRMQAQQYSRRAARLLYDKQIKPSKQIPAPKVQLQDQEISSGLSQAQVCHKDLERVLVLRDTDKERYKRLVEDPMWVLPPPWLGGRHHVDDFN